MGFDGLLLISVDDFVELEQNRRLQKQPTVALQILPWPCLKFDSLSGMLFAGLSMTHDTDFTTILGIVKSEVRLTV